MDGQYHITFFTLIVEPLHKIIHNWVGPLKARTIFQVITTMSSPTLILQKEKQRTWCRPALSINHNTHSNSYVYFAIFVCTQVGKKRPTIFYFTIYFWWFYLYPSQLQKCFVFLFVVFIFLFCRIHFLFIIFYYDICLYSCLPKLFVFHFICYSFSNLFYWS